MWGGGGVGRGECVGEGVARGDVRREIGKRGECE